MKVLWFIILAVAAPALAAGPGDGVVAANVAYALAQDPAILLAQAEPPPEEEFVFGATESEDKVIKPIALIHFQDTTGKASRDMKKIIGWTLIATGGLSAVWSAFFHTDTHLPYDYYAGADKYELLGRVPLIHEKTAYWPSVIAGAGLAGGGLWLMNHQ